MPLLRASASATHISRNEPPNDFEQDIYDALNARGINLIPQVGASRYRIDMVAEHPRRPGRFVLAIECDGATYHSSNTARDRDRLRQHQLEALGWRFHRIWSTDWFMRKEQEVERAIKAFNDAVAFADRLDSERPQDEGGGNSGHAPRGEPGPKPNGRGPLPIFTGRSAITDYNTTELMRLVQWVKADGLMRTDDELVREMVEILGFSRRGARIEITLRKAINLARG
jgi:very-short-patch-repair endonuclease